MIPNLLATGEEARVTYQLARLELLDQWWHWLTLLLVLFLFLSYVFFWYRRDWVEIPRPLGITLLLLRLAALLGILVFFLDLQKRTEQKVVRSSRLAVLVDTSLSMTLPLDPSPGGDSRSRISAILEVIQKSSLVEQLREKHDTTVYRFDQSQRPISVASFLKQSPQKEDGGSLDANVDSWWLASTVAWAGSFIGMVGLLSLAIGILGRWFSAKAHSFAYFVLTGAVCLIASMVFIATASLRASEYPLASLWSKTKPEKTTPLVSNQEQERTTARPSPRDVAWGELLTANGSETRLGDAIKAILESEKGAPLAGIVVLTDGQSTTGVDPLATIPDAMAARVPIIAVGLGSDKSPVNARVVEVQAPNRVFPGDRFRITTLIQASGMKGRRATLQLRSSASGKGAPSNFKIEEETPVDLPDDETLLPVHFDVLPKEIGEWTYDVKLLPPQEDSTPTDNGSDTLVRVIEPKYKVLTIAGGPTREYQFVRNMLFREKTVQSHVFLQTGSAGMSQEAHQLLEDFPNTITEMAEYDCVIAFDADWMKLRPSQLETLEEWVSRHAGGLIMIVGPVATPRWTGSEGNGDRRAELLRGLSPVEINPRGTRLLSVGRFEGTVAWPLNFTEDGKRMEFLGVGSNADETREAWERFQGVYSYYACYDPKPGALTLAEFSDPTTINDGRLPIFLASHFYGSGRVVFQGSGEFWRMREIGVKYFDSYYTKLIRWVGQGRLLRDSNRGMLLVESDEALVGEQIALRAVLKDTQFQPLLLPQVEARLIDPQQRSTPLVLLPLQDPTQPGVYIGQFLAAQAGSYQIQLALPGGSDPSKGFSLGETLTQQVAVRVPTREVQRTQRNDSLLMELTGKTGGKYFGDWKEAFEPIRRADGKTEARLESHLPSQDQVNYLSGAPDREFQWRLMTSLMSIIAGSLCLEWLLRRLNKLA